MVSFLTKYRTHHNDVGALFSSDLTTEDDIDFLSASNRNYRLGMFGIRCVSMVQAIAIFLRSYHGK